nr:PREDICTED: probable disease resistance protein RF9 isoform X1 [Daucus carota subsp. sativus]
MLLLSRIYLLALKEFLKAWWGIWWMKVMAATLLSSLVGWGGLGKTTLARKIYNHSTIKKHFSGLAWVSISQKWQPKAVLQRILVSLVPEKRAEILHSEVDKLVENLLEIQLKKNCLIVLDDIWSIDAWDSLKAAFPNEICRTKIMLTSRNVDVASHVNPRCFVYKPQVLDAEQSWELLRLKALPKPDYLSFLGGCYIIIGARDYQKMEEWGRELVQNCSGLPLAIVVLGGILVTKPTFYEWEKVYYDSLSSLKRGKGLGEGHREEVFEFLVWSYNDLPSQLKLCFLYMGKFAEDEDIEAETLYQLWIAEGMVLSSDKREGETLMQVAESYMGELVHKSMVQVIYEDDIYSQRKFKSCLLHDLMRDLSMSIAKGEDFFKVANIREVNDFPFDPSLQLASSSPRQLVIYLDAVRYKSIKYLPFLVNKYNQRRVRSVLLFANNAFPTILVSHVANFRFLRVFALEGVDLNKQSEFSCLSRIHVEKCLGSLVHLRYLSLRGSGTDWLLFPCIQKLKLLKTLRLDVGYYLHIPPWISTSILSKLECLQHLYLPSFGIQSSGKNIKLRFNGLSLLETLENFDPDWCEVKDIPRLISLQKLTVKVKEGYKDLEDMVKCLSSYSGRYLNLDIDMCDPGFGADIWRQLFSNHTSNLQKLLLSGKLPELGQIFGQQKLRNTHDINVSLIHITSLRLWESCLEEDPMPILEKIPTLRNLDLTNAYVGKEMVCSANGFQNLERLVLWNLHNLVKWEIEKGSMPILLLLRIRRCRKLEELPEGLKFLSSLEKIEINGMPSDFNERVRVVDGEAGPDFYKVAHIPDLEISGISGELTDAMILKIILGSSDSE